MKIINRNMKTKAVGLSVLAFSLVVAAIPAGAESNKKGPRASVSVATVCEHDYGATTLTVELRVRDKTSGNATPLVDDWKIDASYLERGVPGNQWQLLDTVAETANKAVPVTITETFSLCAATGGIRDELLNARTLNGLATVTYGKVSESGVDDVRTVNNRCSDDPKTLNVIEPSGIKLSREEIDAIDVACVVPTP